MQFLDQVESDIRSQLVFAGSVVAGPVLLVATGFEVYNKRLESSLILILGLAIVIFNLGLSFAYLSFHNRARVSVTYLFLATLFWLSLDNTGAPVFFCLMLPLLSSMMLGYREALYWNIGFACLSGLLVVLGNLTPMIFNPLLLTNLPLSYSLVVLLVFGVELMRAKRLEQACRQQHLELSAEIDQRNEIETKYVSILEDLQLALEEVQELSGLMPICSGCKKVRDDDGFWEQVDTYFHKRTQITFSHSLCPGCSDAALESLDEQAVAGRANY